VLAPLPCILLPSAGTAVSLCDWKHHLIQSGQRPLLCQWLFAHQLCRVNELTHCPAKVFSVFLLQSGRSVLLNMLAMPYQSISSPECVIC
jgi:hypothetical protein